MPATFIKPDLELDIHRAANVLWRLQSFDSGPLVLRSCTVADGRRARPYCATPTCECNCNCTNVNGNLAEKKKKEAKQKNIEVCLTFPGETKGQINMLMENELS